jgi:hypothetical protein
MISARNDGIPGDMFMSEPVAVKHKEAQDRHDHDQSADDKSQQRIAAVPISRIPGHAILQLETSFENGLRGRQFLR